MRGLAVLFFVGVRASGEAAWGMGRRATKPRALQQKTKQPATQATLIVTLQFFWPNKFVCLFQMHFDFLIFLPTKS